MATEPIEPCKIMLSGILQIPHLIKTLIVYAGISFLAGLLFASFAKGA